MRESGILMPIFSIPSKFGIGTFSRESYEFVDFLEKSGVGYWQILPLGPTGYGNSPYQGLSAFAVNPYFIDIEKLIEDGYLTWDEANAAYFGSEETKVDYGALYENRRNLLKKAFERFKESEDDEIIKEFVKKQKYWLLDYALFMAVKESIGGGGIDDFPDDIKKRDKKALDKAKKELKDLIEYYYFEQYIADSQLKALKEYASSKKVKIIGDIPFYVSADSCDRWAHPECFDMDEDNNLKTVAGCPPDAFSQTGQLWGNPIYNWDAMKKDGYSWWADRIKRQYELVDVIRIDHFHGFCSFYEIKAGRENAKDGTMKEGPGIDFFKQMEKKLGKLRIIAEDLGNNTKENEELLEKSGFPGMKVLQYGFTSWDSCYVNHKHINNCVVYTGTHDNTPTRAWVEEINDGQREFTRKYINSMNTDYNGLVWDLIREAYRSVANLCIIPLQDFLCFGKESRINTPGCIDGNWQWRLKSNYLSDDLAGSIRSLAEIYGRIPQ